jgi:hypothetical protein
MNIIEVVSNTPILSIAIPLVIKGIIAYVSQSCLNKKKRIGGCLTCEGRMRESFIAIEKIEIHFHLKAKD